jgi:hypothetical protein
MNRAGTAIAGRVGVRSLIPAALASSICFFVLPAQAGISEILQRKAPKIRKLAGLNAGEIRLAAPPYTRRCPFWGRITRFELYIVDRGTVAFLRLEAPSRLPEGVLQGAEIAPPPPGPKLTISKRAKIGLPAGRAGRDLMRALGLAVTITLAADYPRATIKKARLVRIGQNRKSKEVKNVLVVFSIAGVPRTAHTVVRLLKQGARALEPINPHIPAAQAAKPWSWPMKISLN